MITQIKSKIQVSINIADLTEKNFIYCIVDTFIQTGNEYIINGSYCYGVVTSVDPETSNFTMSYVPIKNFSRQFTNEQIDALYSILNVTYPENSTYTEKRACDLKAGAFYIVSSESMFGLTINDWE